MMSNENPPDVAGDIEIRPTRTPVASEERARLLENPGFGRLFSDHMVVIPYQEGRWQRGSLQPFGPLSLSPATAVLHYGQVIFEGFKAYRQPDGSIKTFRPMVHARRLNNSARRMAMPELPPERFVAAVDALIRQDHAWVPGGESQSYYLRPFMMATDPMLGVRPSKTYAFYVIGSPAGSYFASGLKPVTVWVSREYVRAAPGGTGFAKCAGNYAASLAGQKEADEKGCDQVVWLDAIERRYVEEMGGMNLCFVFREGDRVQVVTPELSGTILPGVTRDSILTLARDLGYEAVERKITVDEWERAVREGRMTEAFACGTAATVTPIGHVKTSTGDWSINNGEPGPVAKRLRELLQDIQYGRGPDRHEWMHSVVKA